MARWEEFSSSKEYKLCQYLRDTMIQYELNEDRVHSLKDLTDFWEPLYDKLFRLGLQWKQTGKLKEIKSEWMRPLFFSGIEEKIKIDGKIFPIVPEDKEVVYKAQEIRRNFGYLVSSLLEFDKIDSFNFKKLKKSIQDNCKGFFKNLIIFVTKKLYDKMKTFQKSVLRPLLDLRKANYHLFNLEKKEEADMEITFFKDKKDFRTFTETMSHFFQDEEIRLKRDCDEDHFEDYLNRNNDKTYYQYNFMPKVREGFTYNENTKTKKGILQRKFEEGMSSFLHYLWEKQNEDFPIEIDVHKLFKNMEIPKIQELKSLKFYSSELQKSLRDLKEKMWEMKINGLARIKMPITENVEVISIQKNIFDLHIILENIAGNKLKYDQYLFVYQALTFIIESNVKEEITIFKDKNFMEDVLPKYMIYNALRQSVNILLKMKQRTKDQKEYFDLKNFIQPLNYEINNENISLINAWYYTEAQKQIHSAEIETKKKQFFNEVELFEGRFWILEGLFNPEDKSLWMEAIDILKDINILVQDDIRDYILTNFQHINQTDKDKDKDKDKEDKKTNTSKRRESRKSSNAKVSSVKKIKQFEGNTGRPINANKKKVNMNRRHEKEKSFESDDESILQAGRPSKNTINLETLRPPNVWNFPVDLLQKKMKDEEKKIEVKNVDPRNFYKDGRVGKFLDLLEKIKIKLIEYCILQNDEKWKYYFDCVLKTHSITYNFYGDVKKKPENEDEQGNEENNPQN